MADDLDELLDEIESKFCSNASLSLRASSDECPARIHAKQIKGTKANKSSSSPTSTQRRTDIEDIDALIDDIFEDEYDSLDLKQTEQLSNVTKAEKGPVAKSGQKKCCPVFLGGSLVANGVGTAISQRSCDQLRCTSCDFRIAMFDDHEWDPSCDYLFFRNNMPDCLKLRAKLRKRKGVRAYACQCSWHSARDLADLTKQPKLKWVCGKHSA
ncbi:cilia- and flagella-associated protein 418 isoform X1 [Hypomesus transpacificus]|uniref:cilia- and flagella-associated protein 418 isoform X1 n=1 Tax=Hypomesus transpacificus TaxID=137520 RepID=UPI001F081C6B|nr:cilia- and flagella-associated protein 418 isoform X1 [Hypomesus transpacificus]